jgi:NAD(P)-dependent dehydrogenase (short-subunit alcohol dehydrogenase family)
MIGVFVTGSADGIGLETARQLLAGGHRVVGHARNEERAAVLRGALPGLAGIAVGDLSSIAQVRAVAAAATAHGPYEVVIHNAGISRSGAPDRLVTADGLEATFAVNVLAPYLLTALMPAPARLVYLTSGLESEGIADLADLQWERKRWNGRQAYRDSKLHDVALALAVARQWPGTRSNAVDPGWIRTRMGGPHAPDPLPLGAETQVWLAVGEGADDPANTGRYFKRRTRLTPNPAATDRGFQDGLLAACAKITGDRIPANG